jgi:hypothetical protein
MYPEPAALVAVKELKVLKIFFFVLGALLTLTPSSEMSIALKTHFNFTLLSTVAADFENEHFLILSIRFIIESETYPWNRRIQLYGGVNLLSDSKHTISYRV